jgi:hypothetical protein
MMSGPRSPRRTQSVILPWKDSRVENEGVYISARSRQGKEKSNGKMLV